MNEAFENDATGDDKDRWNHLMDNFTLKEQIDVFEEYDGANQEEAEGLVLMVTLPLLARGHAIQTHLLNKEFIQVTVPHMYHLVLALPVKVTGCSAYYDCKIRKLFLHFSKQSDEEIAEVNEEDEDDIIEIDTSEHKDVGESRKPQNEEPVANAEDDMLYDLC